MFLLTNSLALAISAVGILHFLLIVAVLVLAFFLLRYLLALGGITIPPNVMAIIGVIVVILLLLWFLGGSTGISLR